MNRKERVGGQYGGCEEEWRMVSWSKEPSVAGAQWVVQELLRQNQGAGAKRGHQDLVDEQKGCRLYAKHSRKPLLNGKVICSDSGF